MAMDSLVLVANPGSASRKYALYREDECLLSLHFEKENIRIIYSGKIAGKDLEPRPADISHLTFTSSKILQLLTELELVKSPDDIGTIAFRVVAPAKFFQQDRLLNEEALEKLTRLEHNALLHINATLQEISQLRQIFPKAKLVGVSDSAFQADKPLVAKIYGLPLEIQKELDIERFGYHGLSVESAVNQLKAVGKLPKRLIVCHLGSGSSVTAVKEGKAIDCSMGYSPLEGLIMATRSGNLDVAAALGIKTHLGMNNRQFLEYLNSRAGLLGVSGSSDDIRELLAEEQKSETAKLALDLYVYKIQQTVGAMAATLGGIDGLVFTATVGERSAEIRKRVLHGLLFLGLSLDPHLNHHSVQPGEIVQISPPHHPAKIYIVPANEYSVIAAHAQKLT